MYPFEYRRAATLADALSVLGADADAKPLAGGMTLIPSMKHRLAAPTKLIDIGALPELQGIAREGDRLLVGAGSTHARVADNALVRDAIGALATLAQSIGDPQVRARGTIGGSVANNDPAADYPAAVLALDARIDTDRRGIDAADFFQGMFATALEPDELIRRIAFRIPRRAAYAKFHHPASGYAMAGVFVAEFADGPRVAVTGAGASVFRWLEAEQALARKFDVAALEGVMLASDGLNEDMHASAQYRAHLAGVMARRAIAQCIAVR